LGSVAQMFRPLVAADAPDVELCFRWIAEPGPAGSVCVGARGGAKARRGKAR
jgi:thiamine pyrophosphokinase